MKVLALTQRLALADTQLLQTLVDLSGQGRLPLFSGRTLVFIFLTCKVTVSLLFSGTHRDYNAEATSAPGAWGQTPTQPAWIGL